MASQATEAGPAGREDDSAQDIVSTFPLPSLDYFARFFSVDLALDQGAVRKSDQEKAHLPDGENAVEEPPPPPPPPLRRSRFPSPPPVPEDLCTESFGAFLTPTDHNLRELEEQGIDRLREEHDEHHRQPHRQAELKRLMWSSIAKFFEILECLIRNPGAEQRTELAADLQLIFINFHHTVNQYRRPQAYASLVELLKFQTLQSINQAEGLLDGMMRALEIAGCGEEKTVDGPDHEEMDVEREEDGAVIEGLWDFRREIGELRQTVVSVRTGARRLSRGIPRQSPIFDTSV